MTFTKGQCVRFLGERYRVISANSLDVRIANAERTLLVHPLCLEDGWS